MVEIAFDIAQNSLDQGQMGFPWIVYEQTDLLDGICNVWTGEREVLQGTS
jgi:hypothetical protein